MYVCINTYIYIYTYIIMSKAPKKFLFKLLYELRSRVVCYPKIKLSPRVLGFCFILCCAQYDASILNYVHIYEKKHYVYIYICTYAYINFLMSF